MTRTRKVFGRAPVGRATKTGVLFNTARDFETVLVFDTETTTDFTQKLRVGAFQLLHIPSNTVLEAGLFIPSTISDVDKDFILSYSAGFKDHMNDVIAEDVRLAINADPVRSNPTPAWLRLSDWVSARGEMPVYSRETFALFMLDHLQNGGAVAGHNLLFDLGAICSAWWGHDNVKYGKGFSFALCECEHAKRTEYFATFGAKKTLQSSLECPDHPAIMTRQLNGRKVQYGLANQAFSGPMFDSVVLGRALLGPGALGLGKLGERFRCLIRKRGSDDMEHGSAFTTEYLDYLICDVAASLELFMAQVVLYQKHGLSKPLTTIFSEASVGKAYLNQLGITTHIRDRPFFIGNSNEKFLSRDLIDAAQEAYQGARSEVMLRLTPATVAYCDFKSQYPSVNAIMKLQELLIAESYSVFQGPETVILAASILSEADHEWLRHQENWPRLRILVKINPQGGIFPTKWNDIDRWKDAGSRKPYGMVRFAPGQSLTRWYPLCDVVASKLLTGGHMPEILDAIEVKQASQICTPEFLLFGHVPIDLSKDDLFAKVIEERTRVRASQKKMLKGSAEHVAAEAFQNALKLIANSTSYGVMAETRMEGAHEVGGQYYAPFIAAHITGASRLLLAIAETLAHNLGARELGLPIRYAMCDTDSMAFVKPDNVSPEAFNKVIDKITGYFEPLSPYENDKNLFARETDKADQYGLNRFFGVSCKRYVLYVHDIAGAVKFNKISSHGTGAYMFDREMTCYGGLQNSVRRGMLEELEIDTEIDCELEDDGQGENLSEISTDKKDAWKPYQAFMWARAIERAEGKRKPDTREAKLHCGFPNEPWSQNLTRLPVSITTPGIAADYAALGIRPASFFLALPRREGSAFRAAIPYNKTSVGILASEARDVKTGAVLHRDIFIRQITTLFEAMGDYFVNPERKAKGRGIGPAQSPGWLGRHELTFDGIELRNRKGKSMSRDLFAGNSDDDE